LFFFFFFSEKNKKIECNNSKLYEYFLYIGSRLECLKLIKVDFSNKSLKSNDGQ